MRLWETLTRDLTELGRTCAVAHRADQNNAEEPPPKRNKRRENHGATPGGFTSPADSYIREIPATMRLAATAGNGNRRPDIWTGSPFSRTKPISAGQPRPRRKKCESEPSWPPAAQAPAEPIAKNKANWRSGGRSRVATGPGIRWPGRTAGSWRRPGRGCSVGPSAWGGSSRRPGPKRPWPASWRR
jgi:hypothetical protein